MTATATAPTATRDRRERLALHESNLNVGNVVSTVVAGATTAGLVYGATLAFAAGGGWTVLGVLLCFWALGAAWQTIMFLIGIVG